MISFTQRQKKARYILQKTKKVQVDNDQDKAQSQRNSHFKNRVVKN